MTIVYNTTDDIKTCLAIRHIVFIDGQNVPLNEEIDGLDEACDHFIAHDGDIAVATCRVRNVDNNAKIERVGVLAEYRGQGIGRDLMRYVINDIKAKGDVQAIKLGSQQQACAFYSALGFTEYGNPYIDAGIDHINMILEL